jgi:S1-C subfamily serine protease
MLRMDWPEIVGVAKDAIVRVWSGGQTGTAFHVDGGAFITAHHVIASRTQVELEWSTGGKVRAQPSPNPALASVDLIALIPDSPQSIPTLPLGNVDDARLGEDVLFGGYPLESNMPLTFHKAMIAFRGRRTFPPQINRQVDCIQLDGSVNLGNSGGPVLNREGRVIGVISARYGRLTAFLENFLKDQIEFRARVGTGATISMGVVQIGGKTYKQFDVKDAQNAFIDIVSMLHRHTNVGIGWAISSEYIRQHR